MTPQPLLNRPTVCAAGNPSGAAPPRARVLGFAAYISGGWTFPAQIATIRFYEQIGLLPAPPPPASDRRLYDDAAFRRLSFVRHARQLGFNLEAIRSLLDLSDHPDRPCGEANVIAERHLAEVGGKIAQLQALQTELTRMTAECAGGRVSACKVIEVLHDHDLCAAGDHQASKAADFRA